MRTGGSCPGPMRTGGGAPLLKIIFQAVAAARGSAYDQTWPPASAVGIENMAVARAITFDAYGANRRLANNFFPSSATIASGMLPRWERIFGLSPASTDSEVNRRAAVSAAWLSLTTTNALQPIADALQAAMGPVFVAITHQTPATAVANWPGGTPSTLTPWTSTIAHLDVQVTPSVAGYHNADGTPNAAFWAFTGTMFPILDKALPAWATFDWYVASSHGGLGFYLDEPDLDLEALDV